MSKAIQITQATKKLQQAKKQIERDMKREANALAKGIYIAMSNASVKKGSGKKPKQGSKKSYGDNWMYGPLLFVSYRVHGRIIKEYATDWIDRLKEKSHVETFTDKKGKSRRRKVSPFLIVRGKNQKKPGELYSEEIWRRGSSGNLPFSWGNPGLANYYLRKQWTYEVDEQLNAKIKISPAIFNGEENNERVLRLIDKGGSGPGTRKQIGFWLSFRYDKHTKKTKLTISKEYAERKMVRMRGFQIKSKTVARINRVLKRVRPSKITTPHWRRLGSGK